MIQAMSFAMVARVRVALLQSGSWQLTQRSRDGSKKPQTMATKTNEREIAEAGARSSEGRDW